MKGRGILILMVAIGMLLVFWFGQAFVALESVESGFTCGEKETPTSSATATAVLPATSTATLTPFPTSTFTLTPTETACTATSTSTLEETSTQVMSTSTESPTKVSTEMPTEVPTEMPTETSPETPLPTEAPEEKGENIAEPNGAVADGHPEYEGAWIGNMRINGRDMELYRGDDFDGDGVLDLPDFGSVIYIRYFRFHLCQNECMQLKEGDLLIVSIGKEVSAYTLGKRTNKSYEQSISAQNDVLNLGTCYWNAESNDWGGIQKYELLKLPIPLSQ